MNLKSSMGIEEKRREIFLLMKSNKISLHRFKTSEAMFYNGIKCEMKPSDYGDVYGVFDTSTDLYKEISENDLDLILKHGLYFVCDRLKYNRRLKKIERLTSNLENEKHTSYGKAIVLSTIENLKESMNEIKERRKEDKDFFVGLEVI
jgi:hypothetical protein